MDPFTQGMLGTAAAQVVAGHKLGWKAAPLGLAAGMLADADVFLRAFADPALPNELHRHFTHSFAFMPIGALLAASVFLLIPVFRRHWKWTLAAALAAYATHAPLDACTAYGTKLLWPFSSAYIACDNISIIDPLFTVPLAVGVGIALIWQKRVTAVAGITLLFCLSYLTWGLWQQSRAYDVQLALRDHRNHTGVTQSRVMPTLGNLLVWRSVYVHDGTLYADAVRVVPFNSPQIEPGLSVPVFTEKDLPTDPLIADRVRDVFSRFSAFSDGFMARANGQPNVIADMRYSLEPAGLDALWGLRLQLDDIADPVRSVGLQHLRENLTILAWRNFAHAYTGPPDMVPLNEWLSHQSTAVTKTDSEISDQTK